MTSYDSVYDRFLMKIEDLDLARMSSGDQSEMLVSWLNSALAMMEMENIVLNNDFTSRDDDEETFEADLTNSEIELIALYMTVAWYEARVNSLEHTSLFVGSSSEKWTNQLKHMEMIANIRDRWKNEARKLYRAYNTHNNSYLNGD